jgi:hypothetical protein
MNTPFPNRSYRKRTLVNQRGKVLVGSYRISATVAFSALETLTCLQRKQP